MRCIQYPQREKRIMKKVCAYAVIVLIFVGAIFAWHHHREEKFAEYFHLPYPQNNQDRQMEIPKVLAVLDNWDEQHPNPEYWKAMDREYIDACRTALDAFDIPVHDLWKDSYPGREFSRAECNFVDPYAGTL